MSRARNLLANAFDIVGRIENPDRGVNVIKVDDQLSQGGAGMRDLPAISARFSTRPARVFGRSTFMLPSAANIRARFPISDGEGPIR